jgi:hypothetical protein
VLADDPIPSATDVRERDDLRAKLVRLGISDPEDHGTRS